MKNLFLCIVTILLNSTLYSQSIAIKLQAALDSIYLSHPKAVGIMVHVESPEKELSWSGSSGYADQKLKIKLDPKQPILIASSIKTYVSESILRLVEKEQLGLNMPIGTLLSEKTKDLFEEDGYNFSKIKIKHLLSHTSGIEDYANQDYIDYKDKHRKYRWTRDEQLELAVKVGDPLGKPGAVFGYADANYLLLTEIIEKQTGQPFYEAMRKLLRYEELGLKDTWFPTLEKMSQSSKPLAHQYWGEYGWDSYDLDISWDLYGGGGIACPTKDLAKFVYHLFNGDIIKNKAVQNLIFTEITTKQTELFPYYLGLTQDNYHGMNGFGHGGFWGTVMMYFPSINTAISVCILDRDERALRRDVLDAVSKIIKAEYQQKLNLNNQIKSYLNQLTDFTGTILVAQKDAIIEQKAYGLSSIEGGVKNNIETKFNIASITKLITSIATLQLQEQGKIDLKQTVGVYLPDYPNKNVRDSVTIHQLLTHTSGLPPFYREQYLESNKLGYNKVSDFLPLFVADSLNFTPGEKYQYNGAGFVVLGLIIEKVTAMDYYDYVSEFIFKKAGMSNTFTASIDSVIINKANGYTSLWGKQSYLSRNDYYISKASPAAGHYSTINDLYSLSKAIRNDVLISKESKQLLLTPKVKGYNTHLGYGIDIDQRYNERIIGHSGGWFGVRAELMDFLASEYTIVVLSNVDDNGKSGASKVIEDLKIIIAGEKRVVGAQN